MNIDAIETSHRISIHPAERYASYVKALHVVQHAAIRETPTSLVRRWWTLSLRVLMLLIALLACWLAWQTNRARTRQRAIASIERAGGEFTFDDMVDDKGEDRPYADSIRPAWQNWLMRALGDDYVRKPRVLMFTARSVPGGTLTEETRQAILELSTLVSMDLEGFDDVDDAYLARLPRLNGLRVLGLGSTRITDAGLTHLTGMRHLTSLDLKHTQITDAGLAQLKGLPQLTSLDLEHTQITDAGLADLNGHTELALLWLNDTRVSDAGLVHLTRLHGLRDLGLDGTGISDAGLVQLGTMHDLESLVLNSHITDAGLKHLTGLTKLHRLSLGDSAVTDAGIAHLSGLVGLEKVNLAGTHVTDGSLRYLRGLPKLKLLEARNTRMTDEALDELQQANAAIRFKQ
jgi:Leucine-rich repeat (LRR) protein